MPRCKIVFTDYCKVDSFSKLLFKKDLFFTQLISVIPEKQKKYLKLSFKNLKTCDSINHNAKPHSVLKSHFLIILSIPTAPFSLSRIQQG